MDINHRSPIRVRYAETDMMGFVWNGVYNTYFEIGRTEVMRYLGLTYRDLEDKGIQLPLIEAHARYFQPGKYDDLLEVETNIRYEGGVRLKFEYNILRDNTTITSGYTLHTFMNAETKKPVKPPKEFLDVWENLQKK